MKGIYPILICAGLLLTVSKTHAQRIFVATADSVYELTGGVGNCTYNNLGRFCLPTNEQLLSLAMHKDTMYILTSAANLYRVLLSTPGYDCKLITNFPRSGTYAFTSFTALTCDQNGVLYAVDFWSTDLYQYNPNTNEMEVLGELPARPAGDMLFYNGNLLYAGDDANIYAVNMLSPSSSPLFMPTDNNIFYGLLATPYDCSRNRLFGITPYLSASSPATLVEIDPLTRKIGLPICKLPLDILDATSSVEDGSNLGVLIDSLTLQAPCGAATTGSLQVFASSEADGNTTFTLDGVLTNTTGQFTGITTGAHSIHIEASSTCVKDSVFTLKKGLSPLITLQTTNPNGCLHPDGALKITASSQSTPITYILNNGTPQTGNIFNNLAAGHYLLSITDAGHCEIDTTFELTNAQYPGFLGPITVSPTLCATKTGSVSIGLSAGTDPSTVTASLNGNPAQPSLLIGGLDAGIDSLHIFNTSGCRYDTAINIIQLQDPPPAIQATIANQLCYSDDGHIYLTITGAYGPYQSSLDSAGYLPVLRYDNLSPSTHTISIRDKNTCSWDTSFAILPYPTETISLSVDTVNPICTQLNSGSVKVTVQGPHPPYYISFNNSTYVSGSVIDHFSTGDYSMPIFNVDGCIVDSAHVHLDLDLKPECNNIYLPNAFSPNGDGVNDVFRPLGSPYLTQIELRVYNRYGGLIFTSSATRQGWDGTFHGAPQPPGTYIWTLGYTDFDKKRKSGNGTVLLVR